MEKGTKSPSYKHGIVLYGATIAGIPLQISCGSCKIIFARQYVWTYGWKHFLCY